MTKKTKIFFALIAALLAAAMLLGACAGLGDGGGAAASAGGRKVSSRVPDFIRKAIMNAPEDALVGVGSAKMATDNMSRTIATTRARAEISRQMSTMIQDMIRDYTAASEVDPSAVISFQENITVALSKAELKGSTVLDMDFTDDGTCWVVVQLSKTNVAQEINQAQAAAKLRIPAMASFNAEERMNEAFDKANKTEVTYSGDDTPAPSLNFDPNAGAENIDKIGPGGGTIIYYNKEGFVVQGYGNSGDPGYFASYTANYLEAIVLTQNNNRNNNDPIASKECQTANNHIAGTATAIGTGRRNTAIIVAHANNTPAAQTAANYKGGNNNDWFLPSKDELNIVWINRDKISIVRTSYHYKTSSQVNATQSWIQMLNEDEGEVYANGYQVEHAKNGDTGWGYIIAMRYF